MLFAANFEIRSECSIVKDGRIGSAPGHRAPQPAESRGSAPCRPATIHALGTDKAGVRCQLPKQPLVPLGMVNFGM